MPLYDVRCEKSGKVFERHIKLKDFEEPIHCACHSPGIRLISPVRFSVDSIDYSCPVSGEWVGSKHEHENNLAKQGCRVLETGESEGAAKSREAEDAELDRKIEDTVERTIESWDSGKKEQLANELVNGGADLAVERK